MLVQPGPATTGERESATVNALPPPETVSRFTSPTAGLTTMRVPLTDAVEATAAGAATSAAASAASAIPGVLAYLLIPVLLVVDDCGGRSLRAPPPTAPRAPWRVRRRRARAPGRGRWSRWRGRRAPAPRGPSRAPAAPAFRSGGWARYASSRRTRSS